MGIHQLRAPAPAGKLVDIHQLAGGKPVDGGENAAGHQVPLVIEMTSEQVKQYAEEYGLPAQDGGLYAREVVENVQGYVLTCVQDSAAFGGAGDGNGTQGATVCIKR
jgi:hypothetical protein